MPLSLYRRGRIWHYRGRVAGRLLRGSTGTTEKSIAEQIINRVERQAFQAEIHGPEAVLTFAQAVELYERARRPMRFVDRLEDHFQDLPVKRITAGQVRAAAPKLYPGAAPATWNRQVIAPTVAIINHAAELELCPRLSVKRFPAPVKAVEPATWSWVQQFMTAANTPEIAALAAFMFLTGARISEALAVSWADVDLEQATAKIRMGKAGGAERVAHLPPELVEALRAIPARSGPLFRYRRRDAGTRRAWETTIRRAGIRPLTFHACRHGFATAALRRGLDPVTVAHLGGWRSPAQVFARYGHAMRERALTDRLVDRPDPVARPRRQPKPKKPSIRQPKPTRRKKGETA